MKRLAQVLLAVFAVTLSAPVEGQLEAPEVTGVWEGIFQLLGYRVRTIYKISLNMDGTLAAVHDTPDDAMNTGPFEMVELVGDSIMMKDGTSERQAAVPYRNGAFTRCPGCRDRGA